MTHPLAKLRLQLLADETLVAETADVELWLYALRDIIERDRRAADAMATKVADARNGEPTP